MYKLWYVSILQKPSAAGQSWLCWSSYVGRNKSLSAFVCLFLFLSFSRKCMLAVYLAMVDGLVCSNEPEHYVVSCFTLLVESPLVNRFVIRSHTKHRPIIHLGWRESGQEPKTLPSFHPLSVLSVADALKACTAASILLVQWAKTSRASLQLVTWC